MGISGVGSHRLGVGIPCCDLTLRSWNLRFGVSVRKVSEILGVSSGAKGQEFVGCHQWNCKGEEKSLFLDFALEPIFSETLATWQCISRILAPR